MTTTPAGDTVSLLPAVPNPNPERDELLHPATAHQLRLDGYHVCRPLPDEPRFLLATRPGHTGHDTCALCLMCTQPRHRRAARRLLAHVAPQLDAAPVLAEPAHRRRHGYRQHGRIQLRLTRLSGTRLRHHHRLPTQG